MKSHNVHIGLRRYHYAHGKSTHTKEVDPPVRVPHNFKVKRPAAFDSYWFMSGLSTDTEFVFINAITLKRVIRTAADGWTREDADSFSLWLSRFPVLSLPF